MKTQTELFNCIKSNPSKFYEDTLGFKLYPYQRFYINLISKLDFMNGRRIIAPKNCGNNIRGNRANFIYYPIYPCTTTKNGRKVFYKVS